MNSNVALTGQQVAERAAAKRAEENEQREKELAQQRYNDEMKQLSKAAVEETKKNNEIAQQSLKVAKDSKYLSKCAIGISVVAIVISVILHYL